MPRQRSRATLVRNRVLYFSGRGVSSLVDPPIDAFLVFRAGSLMGTTESLREQERAIRELSRALGYDVDAFLPDLAGIPRVVVLSRHG